MNSILTNKKILITAGPTREAIDPVRYVSNHSSGKMGYAIAENFLSQGAEVILISGPVSIGLDHPKLTLVNVNTALEMDLACCRFYEQIDVAIFAAAVADYRPESVSDHKIKKDSSSFTIKMVKNVDIAYEFGKVKSAKQLYIGFALETNDELKHAIGKLNKKNFDMVVLNSMNDEQAGFGYDTNKISVIKKDLTQTDYPLKNKALVATDIVQEVTGLILQQQQDYFNRALLIGMTA
ncbi:MAG: phosphopantothenoylcysteine decarboxylase [Ferruginibacter sp.]